jgi:hypothetical protein
MLDRPEQLKTQLQRNVGCHDPRHPSVPQLELSGFEIDEDEQVMRKRPPTHGHG